MKKHFFVFILLLILAVIVNVAIEQYNDLTARLHGYVLDFDEDGNIFTSINASENRFSDKNIFYGDSIKITINDQVIYTVFTNSIYNIKTGETGYIADEFNGKLICRNSNISNIIIDVQQNDKVKIEKYKRSAGDKNIRNAVSGFYFIDSVHTDNIKPGILYHSVYEFHNYKSLYNFIKNDIVDRYGINAVIDLSTDEQEKIYMSVNVPHFDNSIYNDIYNIKMSYAFFNMDNRYNISKVMREFINNDGPYIIISNNEVEKNIFIFMILDALCGASAEEVLDNSMSYTNFKKGTYEYNFYREYVLKRIIYMFNSPDEFDNPDFDWNGIDVEYMNLSDAVEQFLMYDCVMTKEEIEQLKNIFINFD